MAKFEPKPFGKYFLTDRIAIGGMAEIYKAKTFGVDGFEKILAIKKILSHYSSDKEFITMLSDEAKLVVNLSHANIVQVYDLGRVGDDYFISMEFIDGINLRDLIERSHELEEPIPIDIAIYVISEVCRGLDYAHNKKNVDGEHLKIIHRDISPQNILVSFDGGVKIVDFGIAKAAFNLSQTNAGILKGKVNYMAPEQAFGKPMDHRSDLFSLGIVLYEILSGKRLFFGETQMEILKQIRNKKITEDSFGDDIPTFLKSLLAKVLSYSPTKRHPTAADLQIELTRVLYATYNDFTPRKLNELLNKWFADRKKETKERDDIEPDRETILVSSTKNKISQVNIVHREDTAKVESEEKNYEDTVSPEEGLTADFFNQAEESDLINEDEIEPVEKTEKSEVTQPQESIEQMLYRKEIYRNRFYRKPLFRLFVLFALLLVIGFYFYTQHGEYIKKYFGWDQPAIIDDPIDPIVDPVVIPLKADLTLQTIPTGATVWIEGKKLESQTPVVVKDIELNKAYQIKFKLEGYEILEEEINIQSLPKGPLSFELQKPGLKTYTLYLNTEPIGAEIYVAKQSIGKKTPAYIDQLEVNKSYDVELQLDHYQTQSETISYLEPGEKKLFIKLKVKPKAELVIKSKPTGADIYFDDTKSGFQTPYTLETWEFPKQIKVTLKKEGYEDAYQRLNMSEPKGYEVSKELKKVALEQTVHVTANVEGADVYLGQNKIGQVPLDYKLKPGKYKIVVKKNDYKSSTKVFTIQKNDSSTKKLYFKLIKNVVTPVSTTTTTTTTTTSTHTPDVTTSSSNQATYGKLRIDSSPRGASVSINGSAKGITPIVIGHLQKNKAMSIRVSKKGYKTWSRSITLTRDKTEINAVLSQ